MHDTGGVNGVHPLGHRVEHAEGLVDGQGVVVSLGEALLEGLAFHQLHHEEGLVEVRTEAEDLHHVGMAHARHGPGLAEKALGRVRVADELRVDDLHRDLPVEALVEGLVHDAHAPGAEAGDHPKVRAEPRPRHQARPVGAARHGRRSVHRLFPERRIDGRGPP